jgi:DNA-directed RNA polymerase specialized sigma24 family protein
MIERVWHKRGMQPQRKVICSVDGRLRAEQAYTIMQLYSIDRLTIADIARLYGAKTRTVGNMITRNRKRDAEQPDMYTQRMRAYGEALILLDADRERSYREIAKETELHTYEVRKIADRNGLGRK